MIWTARESEARPATLPAAMPPVRLEFVYDYMSRRCVKRLYDRSGEGAAAVGGGAVVEGSAAAVVQSDEEPVAPESGGVVVIPVGWTLTSTFKFVWDGWNLLAELDGEDGVLRTCAWGLDLSGSEQGAGGVGGLVFQYLAKTDTAHHLYYDGNGNVTSLRDDAGALSCEYAYGPFGETLTARGDDAALAYNAFKFSTKYADAESGLLYYGYRYYNPGTGRWLNRDPIEEAGGMSLYGFVVNRAIGHFDRLGLIEDCVCNRTSKPGDHDPTKFVDDWQKQSRQNAGIQESTWPFLSNSTFVTPAHARSQLRTMYNGYRRVYNQRPAKLVWAGGAAFAGRTIVDSIQLLDDIISHDRGGPFPPGFLTSDIGKIRKRFIRMGQAIFDDMGWQHEAYLDAGIGELRKQVDIGELDERVFYDGWCEIEFGSVHKGTMELARYEQRFIVQPFWNQFDELTALIISGMAETEVPGAKSFREHSPRGNISRFGDRWSWLEAEVLGQWLKLDESSRTRLVNSPW